MKFKLISLKNLYIKCLNKAMWWNILLEIIREYKAKTNSLKADKIIENWSDFKSNFKLIVPPSEEEMLGIKKM